MGLINIISNASLAMMNSTSSIFSSGFRYIAAVGSQDTFWNNIWGTICQMGYFIAKWMLYLVDLMFAFIRQLSGLEMKFDSLENMVSKESDFVFNLLFTATDMITPIIRSLIGIAVALIIFFAILAVIKTQFNSLKSKNPADIKGVVKDTLRAFVLLIITPLISIIGIIASNLLLKSLYNATNTTSSTSLSAQIFSASATSASTYRTYAQDGQRIPITFDFTKHQEILDYYKNHPIDAEFRDYVNSNANPIYSKGYKVFTEKSFGTYDSINRIRYSSSEFVKRDEISYYEYYDRTEEAFKVRNNDSDSVNSYKKISSYKPEYYVMADVIDYGIETSSVTYFKTIEEVLASVAAIGNDALFNSLLNTYGIQLLNSELQILVPSTKDKNANEVNSSKSTYREIFNYTEWKVIRYYSTYFDANDESEPTAKMKIEYNHVRKQTDELYGAKFIMAVERETLVDGVVTPYFYPLSRGIAVDSEYSFQSEFIQTGQIIAAKGVFVQETYAYPVPTAIRISEDGSEVQFYRQDLQTVTIGESEDGVNGKIESKKDSNPISTFFNKIAAIFSPKIDLKIDQEAVVTAYTYNENVVNVLSSGKLSISYMFEDWMSTTIGGIATGVTVVTQAVGGKEGATQIGLFGLNLKNVFIPSEINIFMLIAGSLVLVKILFTAVFQLINRSYELFLTIMVYPTACATIPIMDKDEGYKAWSRTYLQRLFSTYGLVLGLNFVIMLLPIISEIEFFAAADIAMSKPLSRFRWLFFSVSYEFLANFLNLVVVIMFELVAFTLIESIPQTLETMTGGGGLKGVNPIEMFGKVMKITKGVVSTVTGVASGLWDIISTIWSDKAREKQLEKLKKLKKGMISFLPGSEVVGAAKDHHHMKEMKKEKKEALNELKDAMANGKMSGKKEEDKNEQEKKDDAANTKNVQDKFNALLKAESAYSSAVSDPRGSREAAEDKKKQNAKLGLDEDGNVSSRNNGDAGEVGEDGNRKEVDLSHRTKRQLKKERKEAKAIVRRLERKEKKANKGKGLGLTKKEQDALEKNKAIVENVESAQKKQKSANKGVDAAKKENKALLKKRKKGTITLQEEQKIAENQKTIEEYEATQKENKQKRKEDAESGKSEKKSRKDRKKEEREKKYKKAFNSMDVSAQKVQNEYFAEFEKKRKKMQKQLKKSGFMGGSLASIQTLEDVKKARDMATPDEMKILDDYEEMLTERDLLLEGSKEKGYIGLNELTARQAGKQANTEMYKRRTQFGTKKGEKIKKKLLGNEQAEAAELERIEQELETLRPTDSESMKKYRTLTKRREQIKANQKFTDYWAGTVGEDGVRTGGRHEGVLKTKLFMPKEERKAIRAKQKSIKAEKKNIRKTELAEGSAYDDLVGAGKKVTPEAIRRQTARRMQPKKKNGKKNK